MASLKVKFGASDVVDLFADGDAYVFGSLTTDHAASSYGQPVFVRDSDGAAMGPAEVRTLEVVDAGIYNGDYLRHESDEAAAADSVSLGVPWTPKAYAGRKYNRDALALIQAAIVAGYEVLGYSAARLEADLAK